MKTSELLKKLKKRGCEPLRDAKGSHQVWHNPKTGKRCVVPVHPSKEIGTGLEKKILKTLLGE
ncbi:type II toxin-antitoxin system HicA family toxin [Riemerella anatipestifer]|nr:type II toxin-antitoxin system HicA family toxin [Riemerella anatipestifer]MDY3532664.1 type II toxin-antitoxin system HicA family toxin [Riemerella anatipestifer]MDY3534782.1 type II toxin-antitoxin system HicA family toxin [Riemerella anatipestifer]